MIVKHGPKVWEVKSESGKSMGHYPSKEAAQKRLRQIEWYKNHPSK